MQSITNPNLLYHLKDRHISWIGNKPCILIPNYVFRYKGMDEFYEWTQYLHFEEFVYLEYPVDDFDFRDIVDIFFYNDNTIKVGLKKWKYNDGQVLQNL